SSCRTASSAILFGTASPAHLNLYPSPASSWSVTVRYGSPLTLRPNWGLPFGWSVQTRSWSSMISLKFSRASSAMRQLKRSDSGGPYSDFSPLAMASRCHFGSCACPFTAKSTVPEILILSLIPYSPICSVHPAAHRPQDRAPSSSSPPPLGRAHWPTARADH